MFKLPTLPYSYDSLEPYIDAKTMEIHHTKHHQAYVDNLNKVLEKYPELEAKSAEELIKSLETIPEDIRIAVKNHGGGHVNHSFFWEILAKNQGKEPGGEISIALKNSFGSFAGFREKFTAAALGRFGSGWAWLAVAPDGSLEVLSTPNQDSPLSQQKIPLLGVDVWEHAYYLKYQWRRAEYIEAFWNVINWERVNENFIAAKK